MAEDDEHVLPDAQIDEYNEEISEFKQELVEGMTEVGLKEVINQISEADGTSEITGGTGEFLSHLQTEDKIEDGISDMNLSNETSKRLATEIQSFEGKEGGYFSKVKSSIVNNQDALRASRMEAVSNLDAPKMIAELLVEGENYATTNQLHVKTCVSNGESLGHNMQCILTNKRMILIDSDDDVINTISGTYKGRFPKSNNLDLVSHNYFSILFKPFRLSDVTDIAVKFRYGSETKKILKRGWPVWAILTAFLLSATILYYIDNEGTYTILSLAVILLMLFLPLSRIREFPIYITKIRQLNITVVNSYTKHVDNLVIDIQDLQSIESVLEWTSILQSLSSATTD